MNDVQYEVDRCRVKRELGRGLENGDGRRTNVSKRRGFGVYRLRSNRTIEHRN